MKNMKRAERRRRTQRIVERRKRQLQLFWGVGAEDREFRDKCYRYLKKHSPFDCGRSHCTGCHGDKIFNVPHLDQIASGWDLKWWKRDYENVIKHAGQSKSHNPMTGSNDDDWTLDKLKRNKKSADHDFAEQIEEIE